MDEKGAPARVAFVTARLGLGGAERQLVSLVNGLDRHRFAPAVICLKDRGELADSLSPDVHCLALGVENGSNPVVVARLVTSLRESRAELVHCTNFNATLWGRAAASRLGIPRVTAEHSTHRIRPTERVLVRVSNSLFDKATDAVVACAHAQVPVLLREGCGIRHTVVIWNGVDPEVSVADDARDRVRTSIGVQPGELLVLVVANLSPQKNHLLLVRAAAAAAAKGASLRLVFAGEGVMRPEIETAVIGLGLQDRVSLLGTRSDVPELLAASDVVALTSVPRIETFPMCLLEAMAAGKPVLATRVGGIEEMVQHGKTGLLVESGEVEALTGALSTLAESPDARRAMGRAGRRLLEERFTQQIMVRRYERLFEGILARRADGTNEVSIQGLVS